MAALISLPVLIHAQQPGNTAFNNIQLHSIHNNKTFSLKELGSKLVAIVFISPECPLSQNYMLTLNQLQQQFAGKLTVIGVFPESTYKDAAYQQFEKKYQVSFDLFKDEKQLLVQALGATITPEVFLINASRQVVYSGAIDDWVVSLGKTRKAVTNPYLKNAVAELLTGLPAKPVKTKAVGCFINLK